MARMTLCLFFATLFISLSSVAQDPVGGELAIGARFGGVSALNVKKFNGNKSAYEFMAGWDFDDDIDAFTITALWEKLAPISSTKQVNAIIGLGPTMAFGDQFRFGATGIFGVDWRFKVLPINLQFDWAPTWFFVNGSDFSFVNGAISVRYILNHKKG